MSRDDNYRGSQFEFDVLTVEGDQKFQNAMLRAIARGAERPAMRFELWRDLLRRIEDEGFMRRRKRCAA
jgi:hypothetical protein